MQLAHEYLSFVNTQITLEWKAVEDSKSIPQLQRGFSVSLKLCLNLRSINDTNLGGVTVVKTIWR